VTETCKRLSAYSQCKWLGAFVAANVENPKTIRADARLVDRARQFGKEIAS
jgi:hypothetical protein